MKTRPAVSDNHVLMYHRINLAAIAVHSNVCPVSNRARLQRVPSRKNFPSTRGIRIHAPPSFPCFQSNYLIVICCGHSIRSCSLVCIINFCRFCNTRSSVLGTGFIQLYSDVLPSWSGRRLCWKQSSVALFFD